MRAAHLMIIYLHAACPPRINHLVTAVPMIRNHDAIVRCCVQVNNVLQADVHVVVPATQRSVLIGVGTLEACLQVMPISHDYIFATEQTVQVCIAHLVVTDFNAHVLSDVLKVFFTDESMVDFETALV